MSIYCPGAFLIVLSKENMWAHTVEAQILVMGTCFIHHVVHDNRLATVQTHSTRK